MKLLALIIDLARWRNLACGAALFLTVGCASYSKTGWYTPDSFNYTYATPFNHTDIAPPTHYFGLSWSLKDK